MTTETLLILIMVIFLVGSWPAWPYSRSWGYAPMGILAFLLAVYFIWVIAEGRPLFRDSGKSIRATVEDAGEDLKAAGRDVADSVRDAVK